MNAYSAALLALVAPLSLCLATASAQSSPRAAIVTGEVPTLHRGKSSSATNPYSLPGRPNTTSPWTSKTALPCS